MLLFAVCLFGLLILSAIGESDSNARMAEWDRTHPCFDEYWEDE